jgi:GT2 family glycosyltransferase
MLETSAAGGGEAAKPWAFEAGRHAVQAHCERTGVSATVTRDESDPGVYHLEPALPQEPPVSIVIPTGGQVREVRYEKLVLVANCLESIVERTTYSNYEVICVLDDSTPDSVRDELSTLGGDRLQLVDFDRPFNFSGKINVGAARASGEHLVLLNDDIEVATPGWIERMVMYSMIPEVGAVGGRLLWEDGRIQHAGIRINDGLPGHPYYGFWREHRGYANAVRVAQDCMAVTGACLMTRRSLFEETGGLSEEFTVNYNDVDYCLSVWAGGRRVVYDPDLVMFHFESSSRSSDVHEWEKERLMEKWLPLTAVDPYTNPNLRYEVPKLTAQVRWAIGRWPRLRIPVRQPADRRRA